MARSVALAVAAALGQGCASCPPDRLVDTEHTHHLTAAELVGYVGEDGVLSEAECEAMCSELGDDVVAVLRCEDRPVATTDTGIPADAVATLACFVTVEVPEECGGRLHAGVDAPHRGDGADPIGAWLAMTTAMELAAVHAFRALADELSSHGAPAALVGRARRAAVEELGHARMLAALARERGGRASSPRVTPVPERSLLDLALENALEGTREAQGALIALHQAEHAADPELRRVMAAIGREEVGHAAWAQDLADWLHTRLDDEGRARVAEAREAAWAALSPDDPPDPALGLPSRERALHLLDRLRAELS